MKQNRISQCGAVSLLLTLAVFLGGCLDGLGAQTSGAPSATGASLRVDVNSADTKLLETLPGVGPVLAQRIIEGRPYRGFEDLEKVKGLGKSKIAALQGKVIFGAVVTPPAQKKMITATGKTTNTLQMQRVGSKESSNPGSSTNRSTLSPAAGKLAPGQKININKATSQELERLPGIGPAKAQAIVDYRNQNGEFKSIESIQQVKGIKAGSFTRIKNVIKLTD